MSAPQLQLRQGDVLAKKYEIDATLGTGPQGTTYLARSLSSAKKYAIKVLPGPAASDAAAAALIQRTNEVVSDGLVRVADTGEHAGQRWMAYEYVEGESLRRLMDEYAGQRKAFSLQEAAQIVVKVLEAMDAAHQKGVLHRHLKPANVIIQTRTVGPGKVVRTVRITGLGYSELIHPGVLTEAAVEHPFGGYMAPELSSPSTGGTRQADVYSAGVLLYELLCGQTPMGTYLSPTQIRDDLPKHVDDIVDLALASNSEDRYPTARDMINDVQRSFQDDDKPVAGISKRTMAVVIGGTLALVGVAAAVLMATDPDAGARRKDEQLRAEVVRENPIPPEDVIRQKLVGHEDMVYVPQGTYLPGRMNTEDGRTASAKEPLAQKKMLDAFYIDRFEWDNQKGGSAVVNVSYEKAAEFCATKGKRLCTADEWERACKGPENHIYSYGDLFNAETCGADVSPDADRDERSDWISGQNEACRSGFGVYDLSGGAREWTSTLGSSNDRFRVLKGGKAGEAVKGSRCAYVEERSIALTDRQIGFRCCQSDGGAAAGAA
ncbi:MAG: SUMF1/EgtB/PvdO family nonheme iron enzyme, partial [Pseudomonadota bacterium]|nr:SUMF1/EgtB/PvdO family nonheme iron enzyme [Pseudomonadota bacterium]